MDGVRSYPIINVDFILLLPYFFLSLRTIYINVCRSNIFSGEL